MKPRIYSFIPAVVWLVFSVVLLTLPGSQLPRFEWIGKYQLDKAIHLFMFFLLCFLFSYPLRKMKKNHSWFAVIAFSGLVFGVAMEFVQMYFVPGRSLEITDMLADGSGCLLAYWMCRKRFTILK